MPVETMRTLLRLRRSAVDGAKQELANCIAAETEAERALSAALLRLSDEADAATDENASDGAVEAYVRWLPSARATLKEAGLLRDRAAEDVSLARTALSIARSEERAVEITLERFQRERATRYAARAQAELDEVAAETIRRGGGDDRSRTVSARG